MTVTASKNGTRDQTAAMEEEQFHAIARALADPRRFAMLQQIASRETTPCSQLEVQGSISPATISHHLKELQESGLVEAQREGRTMILTLRRPVWESYLRRLQQI